MDMLSERYLQMLYYHVTLFLSYYYTGVVINVLSWRIRQIGDEFRRLSEKCSWTFFLKIVSLLFLRRRDVYIVFILVDEISVMNFICFVCLWCLELWIAGMRQENPMREAVWQQVVAGAAELPAGVHSKDNRSSWLILVFMSIMFSGPYLVWKLVSSLSTFHSLNRK
jgi:hypothetical protein